MAQIPSPPAAAVLLARRVQDMVLLGEEPPHLYICREGEDSAAGEPPTLAQIPVIDLSLISSQGSLDDVKQESDRLKSALCSWGCFQAIEHGMSSSFLDDVRRVAREFFEQTMEEKRRYAKEITDFEGYGGDPVPDEGQPLDWQDRLVLGAYPKHRRNFRFWPQKPASFRS